MNIHCLIQTTKDIPSVINETKRKEILVKRKNFFERKNNEVAAMCADVDPDNFWNSLHQQ